MKTIKYFLAITAVMMITVSASAQSALYKKYSKVPDISKVYISSAMFKMMSGSGKTSFGTSGDNVVDVTDIIGKITGLYILSTENKKVSENMKVDVEKMLDGKSLELLMQASDDGEDVNMYVERSGEIIKNFYMFSDSSDEYSMIIISGRFTDADLQTVVLLLL